jgi:hypothetical protein
MDGGAELPHLFPQRFIFAHQAQDYGCLRLAGLSMGRGRVTRRFPGKTRHGLLLLPLIMTAVGKEFDWNYVVLVNSFSRYFK